MERTIVIIGLGQLGRVFAGGFLRAGFMVVPVNRDDDVDIVAARHPDPELVLVAVGEGDLHTVLAALPPQWKTRVGLIQNELLPRDWERHGIADPTVIPVWFEKKKGSDAKPLIPSPVFGPAADIVLAALQAIEIPCRALHSGQDLAWELVRKNVYILTTNIAGLRTGGNVGNLWRQQGHFARGVALEVIQIQNWLTGQNNNPERLIEGMVEAIEADPAHMCTGRSAPARLARALQHADGAGLPVSLLREIRKAAN